MLDSIDVILKDDDKTSNYQSVHILIEKYIFGDYQISVNKLIFVRHIV